MRTIPPLWTAAVCGVATGACLMFAEYVADMDTLDAPLRRCLSALVVLLAVGIAVGGYPLSVWLLS